MEWADKRSQGRKPPSWALKKKKKEEKFIIQNENTKQSVPFVQTHGHDTARYFGSIITGLRSLEYRIPVGNWEDRGHVLQGFLRQINVFGFYSLGMWHLSTRQRVHAVVISSV